MTEGSRASGRQTFLVEIRVDDGDGVFVYKARNLSEGGMFVDCPVPAPLDTSLRITFHLPAGRVDVRGVVRWTTDQGAGRVKYPGMGVAFDSLDPRARGLISGWLAEREAK